MLLLALFAALSTVVAAQAPTIPHLTPSCGHEQHITTKSPTAEYTVLRSYFIHDVIFDCFALDTVPVASPDGTVCNLSAPVPEVHLTATGGHGTQTERVALHNLFRGSSVGVRFLFRQRKTVTVTVKAPGASPSCPVKIRFSATGTVSAWLYHSPPKTPIAQLTSMTPQFLEKSKSMTLTFDYLQEAGDLRSATSYQDVVALLNETDECTNLSPLKVMHFPPVVYKPNPVPGSHPARKQFTWSYAPHTDGYSVVCHRPSTSSAFYQVALLHTFGGNPQYFTSDDITRGASSVNKEIEIVFHGQNLGVGDCAKLVSPLDGCSDSSTPKGGVPENCNLPPAPLYTHGDDNTRAWLITVTRSGIFRVCYKVKNSAGYRPIPLYDELPASVRDWQGPVPTRPPASSSSSSSSFETPAPTPAPTDAPTSAPTAAPTPAPHSGASSEATSSSTGAESRVSSASASAARSSSESSAGSTPMPTSAPSAVPTPIPTASPTTVPTPMPTSSSSAEPSAAPTARPTSAPPITLSPIETPAPATAAPGQQCFVSSTIPGYVSGNGVYLDIVTTVSALSYEWRTDLARAMCLEPEQLSIAGFQRTTVNQQVAGEQSQTQTQNHNQNTAAKTIAGAKIAGRKMRATGDVNLDGNAPNIPEAVIDAKEFDDATIADQAATAGAAADAGVDMIADHAGTATEDDIGDATIPFEFVAPVDGDSDGDLETGAAKRSLRTLKMKSKQRHSDTAAMKPTIGLKKRWRRSHNNNHVKNPNEEKNGNRQHQHRHDHHGGSRSGRKSEAHDVVFFGASGIAAAPLMSERVEAELQHRRFAAEDIEDLEKFEDKIDEKLSPQVTPKAHHTAPMKNKGSKLPEEEPVFLGRSGKKLSAGGDAVVDAPVDIVPNDEEVFLKRKATAQGGGNAANKHTKNNKNSNGVKNVEPPKDVLPKEVFLTRAVAAQAVDAYRVQIEMRCTAGVLNCAEVPFNFAAYQFRTTGTFSPRAKITFMTIKNNGDGFNVVDPLPASPNSPAAAAIPKAVQFSLIGVGVIAVVLVVVVAGFLIYRGQGKQRHVEGEDEDDAGVAPQHRTFEFSAREAADAEREPDRSINVEPVDPSPRGVHTGAPLTEADAPVLATPIKAQF